MKKSLKGLAVIQPSFPATKWSTSTHVATLLYIDSPGPDVKPMKLPKVYPNYTCIYIYIIYVFHTTL